MRRRLRLGQAALESKQNQVGAAADTEFVEQVRNVELYGAFGDVELAGDLFVRKIFEQGIENFLLAAAEIRDRIGLQPAALAGKDGIDETREELARHPEPSGGHQRERANQLVAGFDVGKETFHAEAQEGKAVRFVVLLADDDEPSFGVAFEKIGQERTGGRLCGMRVDDIYLGAGRLEISQIRRERGFQLLGYHLEGSFRQNAFELAQHQRVRRENANRQFGRSTLRSHCPPA